MDDIEKLENLPRRQSFREKMADCEHYRDRNKFDWNKAYRWLRSKVGEPIDKVTAGFVKLDWIKPQYRTFRQLSRLVEMNTFSKGNDIYYFDDYCHNGETARNIKENYSDLFYVHPKTKLLCFQPKQKYSWKPKKDDSLIILGDYHQLLKLNGIWYQVKGKPVSYTSYYAKVGYKPLGPKDRLIKENPSYYDSWKIKIISKKELNSKQLIQLGLKNDVLPVKYGRLKS